MLIRASSIFCIERLVRDNAVEVCRRHEAATLSVAASLRTFTANRQGRASCYQLA